MNAMTNPTTLTAASKQWMTRPADQRFTSLPEMQTFVQGVRDRSKASVISSRRLQARPVAEDHSALVIEGSDGFMVPTNWAFGQIAERAKAPAAYLRKLPAPLVADCLNWGLSRNDATDVGVLSRADDPLTTLAAATGPNYGRIWNSTIIDALINRFGDGVTGPFKVPGEFGQAVDVTRDNTTLYASDRDMFVFLADETNRIEVPNRRDGQSGSLARGFFVWNSEVGSATFGVATFLFDFVCMNRIVWGTEGYREIRLRHTSSAPDRWIEEVAPALIAYSQSETHSITDAIAAAQRARIDDVDSFLKERFTSGQAQAISLAHLADESRPIETVWDAVTGITAYARGIEHQDKRIEFERAAGKVLDLAA